MCLCLWTRMWRVQLLLDAIIIIFFLGGNLLGTVSMSINPKYFCLSLLFCSSIYTLCLSANQDQLISDLNNDNKKKIYVKRFCPSSLTVVFVQETQLFEALAVGRGEVKMCECCVSAIKIFPELDLHPTNDSKVILMWHLLFGLAWGSHGDYSHWLDGLLTPCLLQTGWQSLYRSSVLWTAGCFSLAGLEAELYSLMQIMILILLLDVDWCLN